MEALAQDGFQQRSLVGNNDFSACADDGFNEGKPDILNCERAVKVGH